MTIKRIDVGPRMSQAVVHGDRVYLAGQVADDTSQDVAGQTRQILAKIEALLAKAGSSKDKLLSANVWLSDISTFDEMNSVWDPWVDKENPPCRACVESRLATPAYTVEIIVVAALAPCPGSTMDTPTVPFASWPGLSRPSRGTTRSRPAGLDARNKSGHDGGKA